MQMRVGESTVNSGQTGSTPGAPGPSSQPHHSGGMTSRPGCNAPPAAAVAAVSSNGVCVGDESLARDHMLYLQSLYPYATRQQLQFVLAHTTNVEEAARWGYDMLNPDPSSLSYLKEQWDRAQDENKSEAERDAAFTGIVPHLQRRAADLFRDGTFANVSQMHEYNGTVRAFAIDTAHWDAATLLRGRHSLADCVHDTLPLYSECDEARAAGLAQAHGASFIVRGDEGAAPSCGGGQTCLTMAAPARAHVDPLAGLGAQVSDARNATMCDGGVTSALANDNDNDAVATMACGPTVLLAPIIRWAPRLSAATCSSIDDPGAAAATASTTTIAEQQGERQVCNGDRSGQEALLVHDTDPLEMNYVDADALLTTSSAVSSLVATPLVPQASSLQQQQHSVFVSPPTTRTVQDTFLVPSTVAFDPTGCDEMTAQSPQRAAGETSAAGTYTAPHAVPTTLAMRAEPVTPLTLATLRTAREPITQGAVASLGGSHAVPEPPPPPCATITHAPDEAVVCCVPIVSGGGGGPGNDESSSYQTEIQSFMSKEVARWAAMLSTFEDHRDVFDERDRCNLVGQLNVHCPSLIKVLDVAFPQLLCILAKELTKHPVFSAVCERLVELPLCKPRLFSCEPIRVQNICFDTERSGFCVLPCGYAHDGCPALLLRLRICQLCLQPICFAYIKACRALIQRYRQEQESAGSARCGEAVGGCGGMREEFYCGGVTKGVLEVDASHARVDAVAELWLHSSGRLAIKVRQARVKLGRFDVRCDVTRLDVLCTLLRPFIKSMVERRLEEALYSLHHL